MDRVIQIGCGARGRYWAQIVHESDVMELAAFVDINPEALAKYSEKYPGVPTFTSMDEAFENVEADFAVLVTPPHDHKEQCLKILDAGLDLLAEKPLTLDIEGAVEVVNAFKDKGRQLALCLNFRYLPVTRAYRQWIVEEKVGKPSFSMYHYATNRDGYRPNLNRYPLTLEDAMLIDQSIHHFDLMRFVLDSEIETVTAHTWNPSWSMYESDSVVSTVFEMSNGIYSTYLGGWTGGWDQYRVNWRTDCSEGILVQRAIHSDLAYAKMKDPELTPIELADEVPYIDDTRYLMLNFVNARAGRETLECDGVDHLMTLGPTIACKDSRAEKRTIVMSDWYKKYGIDRLIKDRGTGGFNG